MIVGSLLLACERYITFHVRFMNTALKALNSKPACYAEGVVFQSPASRSARWVGNANSRRTPKGFHNSIPNIPFIDFNSVFLA